MKIGCCLPDRPFVSTLSLPMENAAQILLAGYRTVLDAGYDYTEASVGTVAKLTDSELRELASLHSRGCFSVEACNCFIPGSFHIADSSSLPALTEYVKKVMERMERLGVSVVVFGSGSARRLPLEDPAAELRAIDEFLLMCDAAAERHHLTVAVEPLCKKETNVFNSVSEGASLVRRLDLPHIRLLADGYHMDAEHESLVSLMENRDILVHTHIAEVPKRIYPGAEGGAFIREFGRYLQVSGYSGRVSIECGFTEFEKEIRRSLPLMKEAFPA